MTYTTTVRTFQGDVLVSITDAQIDMLPEDSYARILRTARKNGVHVTPNEIASAAWREIEG